jgi:hypothetical protein
MGKGLLPQWNARISWIFDRTHRIAIWPQIFTDEHRFWGKAEVLKKKLKCRYIEHMDF